MLDPSTPPIFNFGNTVPEKVLRMFDTYSPEETIRRREKGMAGSYYHIVDKKGNFTHVTEPANTIENLGDATEALEELYGMIWWLAHHHVNDPTKKPRKGATSASPAELVEIARQEYLEGLAIAREIPNKPTLRS